MQQMLLVVDDFYENPDQLRQQVLAQPFESRDPSAYHSGNNSQFPMLLKGTDEVFSWLTREPVTGMPNYGHGKWRLSVQGDSRKGDIHVDPGTWSGIVYLTSEKHIPPDQGTEFFRHIESNTTCAPLTDREAHDRFGLKDSKTVLEEIIQRDGTDRTKWRLIQRVPMKFNRLVLFRPWQWHAASSDFGDGPETGRLIQILFFQAAKKEPKSVGLPVS